MVSINEHRKMQNIAREAMSMTRERLRPGMPLGEVRKHCEEDLLDLGANGFWYWNIGAFIFAGYDTISSISGIDYQTPDYSLRNDDLVTIDLSPQRNGVWGDFARTLVIENGTPIEDARDTSNPEWLEGVQVEYRLHEDFSEVAVPSMTFHGSPGSGVRSAVTGRVGEDHYM